MNDFLENLNGSQKEAALATEGPVLILAGPGSGKTKTITSRIAYLLQKGVRPENIIAITFTNKAAEEMRNRIGFLISHLTFDIRHLFIGTFHSLALRILRTHASKIGYLPNFTVFDEDDSLALVKEAMNEEEVNHKQFSASALMNTISGLKNELVTPERYAEETGLTDFFPKTAHRVYVNYQKRLHGSNAMDFDDLISNACRLFQEHSLALESYQNLFRYICVDEYQDVNQAQYVLVNNLAKKHRNLAVVGDDAQAVYGFRGADFRNILNFEKDWPEAKIVILDQNYRSTQNILDAAKNVIAGNSFQKTKNLWTGRGQGAKIRLAVLENEKEEADFICASVKERLQNGRALKDMAVLYRTNAQSRVLEETLLEQNISYRLVGGIRFYHRKEIKDILAYLRFLLNRRDLVSLKRIINVPPRGIGKKTFLQYLSGSFEPRQAGLGAGWNSKLDLVRGFEKLIQDVEEVIKTMPTASFLKYLLKKIGFREYLEDSSSNFEERWENIQEFIGLAHKYDGLESPLGIEKLLEDATLMSDSDSAAKKNVNPDSLTLMTLHSAKGLEFSVIFMAGMEEGIFPHSKALFNPIDIEEERRLCYVGITRAKDEVLFSLALRRARFGSIQVNPPSRFLSEIPEELLEIKNEDEVGVIEV